MRKKIPPAPPQSLGTDGQMPLLTGWTSCGSVVLGRKQTPKICGAVSWDHSAQGLMGEQWLGQCSKAATSCCARGQGSTVVMLHLLRAATGRASCCLQSEWNIALPAKGRLPRCLQGIFLVVCRMSSGSSLHCFA